VSQNKDTRQELRQEHFGFFFSYISMHLLFHMAESRLQAELAQTKLELHQLKERMEIGAVTVHKDLSLVLLIPRWSGSDSMVFLEEFFSITGSSAKISNWKQTDQLQIVILKLCGSVKTFCQGCAELHTKETNWQMLRKHFG
jgi:hypothetical protein